MKSIAVHTPIGWLKISEENGFITEIAYKGDSVDFEQNSSSVLENAKQQIEEYFEGIRKEFDLPFKITGSEFNKKVLYNLGKIPYGETMTYGQLAAVCGNPKAARAVGTAMRKNSFVIVMPCHRVVAANGTLGNYSAGGTANKDWLITFERQNTVPLFPFF